MLGCFCTKKNPKCSDKKNKQKDFKNVNNPELLIDFLKATLLCNTS